VGRGKLEIQNQDSHFSTAQISLRRKEKRRLHKSLDAPPKWTSPNEEVLLVPGIHGYQLGKVPSTI